MIPLVELCTNNRGEDFERVRCALEEDDKIDVVIYNCLDHCDTCASHLFALVEGEVVCGENANDLLANIYAFIANHSL